jgi:hypothetical protein
MKEGNADWLSIFFQGLLGAFLGGVAGGFLVMNRGTRFLADDPETSMIMVAGCVVAVAGLFMRHGDRLLIPIRRVPPMPLQHSALSKILAFSLAVIGAGTVVFGVWRFYYLSQNGIRS